MQLLCKSVQFLINDVLALLCISSQLFQGGVCIFGVPTCLLKNHLLPMISLFFKYVQGVYIEFESLGSCWSGLKVWLMHLQGTEVWPPPVNCPVVCNHAVHVCDILCFMIMECNCFDLPQSCGQSNCLAS